MKRILLVLTMATSAMAGDYETIEERWASEKIEYRLQELERQAYSAQLKETTRLAIENDHARAVTKEEVDAFDKRHRKEWDNWPPKEVPREFEGAVIKFRSDDETHYNHPNSIGIEIRKAIPVAK